ncbi:MAG: thiamine-binding protein [Kocuria sp.]|nr:thiamine-binding protein [Kocuria sp.]MDO4918024.1 thiamine-binding protein [Kocuria sp.]
MLVAFSVSPSGGDNPDASVHDAVAAAVHVVRESGLPNRTDSMFTTIEGEWDECMAVVKEATAAVAEYGPRVSLVLKADIRPGHTGELTGKLERLESALSHHELSRSQERRGITSGSPDGAAGHASAGSGDTAGAPSGADRP